MSDIEREAFERHYASMNDGFCPTMYDGEYDWADAQRCWETWQAARQAPATTTGAEWVKLAEDQPREVDVDVKLNDGSIIRNCLAQSDGDFYWKGGGSEMFILEHTVFAWRSASPTTGAVSNEH